MRLESEILTLTTKHPFLIARGGSSEYRTVWVRLIDDDELVERLAEIERPTGLIRIEGNARLTRSVVDADRDEAGPEPSL